MLTEVCLEKVLGEYIEKVVPNMLKSGYHLLLVKGGPEHPHLSEQTHFAHIINGVFGLSRLVRFLIERRVVVDWLDEDAFRKALALFTIHEVHKEPSVELLGDSQFSIPLQQLKEEYERLGLKTFAQVDEHLMRAVNVHKRSSKHGDLLLSDDPRAGRLWLLVRIADALASAQTPEEAQNSLAEYLAKLSPVFTPEGKYALHYHRIKDVRGVLTNAIHQAVAHQLAGKWDFFPLLYFATGTLYLGPSRLEGEADNIIPAVADQVLQTLAHGNDMDVIRNGLRKQKYDFEQYVYLFAKVEDLLQVVYDETLRRRPDPKFALNEIEGIAQKRKELPAGWRETLEERLGIHLLDPKEYRAFNERWHLASHYLLYVDTILRDLNPAGNRSGNQSDNRLDWFLEVFQIPPDFGENLRREAHIWAKGGLGKYVLVIAHHFLHGPDFADRAAETVPLEQVVGRLHRRVVEAFKDVDTSARRKAISDQLGLRQDLEVYLRENLYLSFTPSIHLESDSFENYIRPKLKTHTIKICSLCNRSSKYVQELRTGILDDFGRVFSNRVLPAKEAPEGNRLWCPLCHLEALLRKVLGMGVSDYRNTRRIYFFVLPTFSFTPEHLRLFESMLRPFHRVTNLPVRDYGKDYGLPHCWLEHRTLDPEWQERLQEVLEREAEKIAAGKQINERVALGRIQGQPHYYLIYWERRPSGVPSEADVVTRTEAWAKALFAAAVISGLTSCKVYVTERPYLPVADPTELKATIILDGPPPALRGLLGGYGNEVTVYGREKGQRSGLERVLDMSAALWAVTSGLQPNKDKYVSARLERLNVDPLAGAYFYKEYGRENDWRSPGSPLDVACAILLEIQGGELMDLIEKVARKSLEIALPYGAAGRGKARRYEMVFREAVSAMRKAQKMIPEMREAALGGRKLSEQSVTELKRLIAGTLLKSLERRLETKRGEIFVCVRGEEMSRLVGEFVDIIVDELYLGRAGGNFTRFLRLENSLADGIYYYTDRNLSRLWNERKHQRAALEAALKTEQ